MSNAELKRQVADLSKALSALSSKSKVKIPTASRDRRVAWEEGCLRSATQLGIDYLLEQKEDESDDDREEEEVRRDNKTLYFRIWESLPDTVQGHVGKDKVPIGDGKALYHKVKKLLLPRTRHTSATLEDRFHSLKMNSSTDFLEFVRRIETTANALQDMGEPVRESQKINRLLAGLDSTYTVPKRLLMRMELENFEDVVEELTAFGLEENLITDFATEEPSGGKPGRPSLYNLSEGNNKNKNNKKKEVCNNYLWGRCKYGKKCHRHHPQGKEGSRKGTKCAACGREGHWSAECKRPNNNKDKTERQRPQQQETKEQLPGVYSTATEDCEAAAYSLTAQAQAMNSAAQAPKPISDSGATHCFTGVKERVTELSPNNLKVRHIDGDFQPSHTATATWQFTTQGGAHKLVTPRCFYKPNMGAEIISESQATDLGYDIYKSGSLCTYAKNGNIVAICHKTNGQYPFDMEGDTPCLLCQQPQPNRLHAPNANWGHLQHPIYKPRCHASVHGQGRKVSGSSRKGQEISSIHGLYWFDGRVERVPVPVLSEVWGDTDSGNLSERPKGEKEEHSGRLVTYFQGSVR